MNSIVTRGFGRFSTPITRGFGGLLDALISGFYRVLRLSSAISRTIGLTSKWRQIKTIH